MYTVTADVCYKDGFLAGLVIPDGYKTTHPDFASAQRAVSFLRRVERENDFIRAYGTGHRYTVSRVECTQ